MSHGSRPRQKKYSDPSGTNGSDSGDKRDDVSERKRSRSHSRQEKTANGYLDDVKIPI